MAVNISSTSDIKYDRLSLIPLGGQSELGQVLWIISYSNQIILVDAGAAYPGVDLPGVDLLYPNTNFLEKNEDKILALLLTNGHEEHSGAVSYLLNHITVPQIMAPRFVATLVSQNLGDRYPDTVVDTVELRHPYEIGPFEVEWVRVNDAIADASALTINTPEGMVVYTSSFKLDQTPVDSRLPDLSRLSRIGDSGVLALISDSAGVECGGYTPSERAVKPRFEKSIGSAAGRVIVVLPGTNTHRLQILFDLASQLGRRVVLFGETLLNTAVVAAVTGNLSYDRKIEAGFEELDEIADEDVLIIATGADGDPLHMLTDLAYDFAKDLKVKEGDLVIYSAELPPGSLRQKAMILDQFLSRGVQVVSGPKDGVHVSKHASAEELKLMLSIINPRFFAPCLGEGRHIMHHCQLAMEWGLPRQSVFPLRNGDILEIGGGSAAVVGSIESQSVLYNRDQGERVTTFSVNERRALSLEGVLTIGCIVDSSGGLIGEPEIVAGASGFLRSAEWENLSSELKEIIKESVSEHAGSGEFDAGALRAFIRETTTKAIRSRLGAKPVIHVTIQVVNATSRLQ